MVNKKGTPFIFHFQSTLQETITNNFIIISNKITLKEN